VLDLRADELRLTQDGQPAEVTDLELVQLPVPTAPASGPRGGRAGTASESRPPEQHLHLVVFLDNVHVSPANRYRLLVQLGELLATDLTPGDRVMVVTYERGLRLLQPFTDDHEKVLQALRAAEASFAGMLTGGNVEHRQLAELQEFQALQLQAGRGDACTSILENMARTFGGEQHNEALAAIAAVETLVRSLTGVVGRKAVLHVSDGIPLVAGYAPLRYVLELCDGSGVASGVPFAVDMSRDPYDHVDPMRVHGALAEYDTSDRWQELAATANLLDVTIFSFDASGLAGIEGTGAAQSVRLGSVTTHAGSRRNRQDSLALVASATGGRAFLDENDASRGLRQLLDDLRSYHLLSFRPPATAAGVVHRLRLETTRPGVELRYRHSYRFRTAHELTADRLLATLVHGGEENAMGLRLEVVPGGRQPGGAPAPTLLRVTVPLRGLTLLAAGDGRQAAFTVMVGALRADGSTTTVRQRSRQARFAAGDDGMDRDYVYEVAMPLPPGEHRVAVAVLDELAGTSSFVRGEVAVP
jgi:VWFA-related protein